MSNLYDKLTRHAEHEGVRISRYGTENVTVECEDEYEVIFDTDPYELETAQDGPALFAALAPHAGHRVWIRGFGDPEESQAEELVLHCDSPCSATILSTDQHELVGKEAV